MLSNVRRSATTCLAFVLVTTGAAVGRADIAPWLGPGWKVRRVVDAKAEPAAYPGQEVAVCDFYTGGLAKRDASDLRVAAEGRRLVPHRVLQVGPGDLVRVAFALTPGTDRYYIYYGNPDPGPTPEAWTPERGVLLEARRWSGGDMDHLDAVRRAWDKAEPVSADFVSNVNFGFNPFADTEAPMMFHYVGWVVVPETGPSASPAVEAGEYEVATSSDDASWLWVDGREVVAWPGEHGAVWDARHVAKRTFTQGVHRLEYWHVKGGGAMTAVAAWRPPGAQAFAPIPPKAFLPVVKASLVEMDVQNERLVADFFPEHAGETWWPDQYAVRIVFKNLSRGISQRQGGRFAWTFGDGQTSDQPEPAHVYLAAGDYTVSLKASRGALAHTFRTVVRVERDWWKQAERRVDPVAASAGAVARYDFKTLDLANLRLAVDLFDYQGMSDSLIAAAAAFLDRQGPEEEAAFRVGLALSRHLRMAGRGAEAVAILRRIEQRCSDPGRKARSAVEAAETLLEDLEWYDEAEREFRRVLADYASAGVELLRRAHIGLGDIGRHRGRLEEARRAYAAAAAISVKTYTPVQAAVRIGTLARYVEEYTRERQWEWAFQYLDEWAWEFPEEKLQGHWSLLRAQALAAKGDRPAALREALDCLAANPQSAYAVRLLMLAAECEIARDHADQARRFLETAVEDYPEDAFQPEAVQRLRTLTGNGG